MKSQRIKEIEIELFTISNDIWPNKKQITKEKPKPAQGPPIERELEPEWLSELEKKVTAEQETTKKPIEEIAEESFFYTTYLPKLKESYEPINDQEKLFQKTNLVSEIDDWWYTKYRTIAQKLRNVTSLRGFLSYLQDTMLVIKKVK